jgi:hypothetical protein
VKAGQKVNAKGGKIMWIQKYLGKSILDRLPDNLVDEIYLFRLAGQIILIFFFIGAIGTLTVSCVDKPTDVTMEAAKAFTGIIAASLTLAFGLTTAIYAFVKGYKAGANGNNPDA